MSLLLSERRIFSEMRSDWCILMAFFSRCHGRRIQVIASGFSTRALVGINARCVVRCVDGWRTSRKPTWELHHKILARFRHENSWNGLVPSGENSWNGPVSSEENSWDGGVPSDVYSLWWSMIVGYTMIVGKTMKAEAVTLAIKVEIVGVDCQVLTQRRRLKLCIGEVPHCLV